MTLEKVARRARVSPATVSRVMSNKISVSGAARARVLKAIEYLNYSPNLIARGLAGVSRSVGVIVSNLENRSSWTSASKSKRKRKEQDLTCCWPTPVTVRSV